MPTQRPTTFPFEFDASKMKNGILRADNPNARALPQGIVTRRPKKAIPNMDNFEAPRDTDTFVQESEQGAGTFVKIPPKKRKRSTKDERNRLKEQIKQMLADGYDPSSLRILLNMRKDRISDCMVEIFNDCEASSYFTWNRQILSANQLRCLKDAEKSKYWEARQTQNSSILLTSLDLVALRRRYGIDN